MKRKQTFNDRVRARKAMVTARSRRALTIPRNSVILPIPRSNFRRNARTGGFLGIEKKFVDYEYGPTAISATWAGAEADPTTALCLNVNAQGDGQNQHEGRQYKCTRLQMRGAVHRDATATQTIISDGWVVRIIVVLDTQTNGAQLNAEDVMVEETAATLAPLHFRNLQYAKRFRVLKDFMFKMDPGNAVNNAAATTVSVAGISHIFKLNIPLNFPPVNSVGTTAAIASVQDYSIHVIACATLTGLELSYSSRVRFYG